MTRKRSREFVYVETDGQVYLVRDRGTFRFPRGDERLPFPTQPNGRMDLGEDLVMKRKPVLDYHPEEWLGRDAIFERTDVDPLVKRAIYTTMIRCVSEVILSKGPRVLMVKAVRGFSKGHWNVPGGFMVYGGQSDDADPQPVREVGTRRLLRRVVRGASRAARAAPRSGRATVAGRADGVPRPGWRDQPRAARLRADAGPVRVPAARDRWDAVAPGARLAARDCDEPGCLRLEAAPGATARPDPCVDDYEARGGGRPRLRGLLLSAQRVVGLRVPQAEAGHAARGRVGPRSATEGRLDDRRQAARRADGPRLRLPDRLGRAGRMAQAFRR